MFATNLWLSSDMVHCSPRWHHSPYFCHLIHARIALQKCLEQFSTTFWELLSETLHMTRTCCTYILLPDHILGNRYADKHIRSRARKAMEPGGWEQRTLKASLKLSSATTHDLIGKSHFSLTDTRSDLGGNKEVMKPHPLLFFIQHDLPGQKSFLNIGVHPKW